MDKPALSDALTAMATAVAAAQAALADDGPEPAAEPEHDYHADQLETIEAEAAATVAVIEAEAAADVARIEAAAEAAPEPTAPADSGPVAELLDQAADADDLADDLADELPADAAPADNAAELLDVDDDVDAAAAVLDALPQLDPTDPADDIAPIPAHWYKRPLWGRGR